jgi:hypothetical protein
VSCGRCGYLAEVHDIRDANRIIAERSEPAAASVPLPAETERDDWHPQGLDEARRMHASDLCKRMPEAQQRWRRLLFGAWAMRDGSQHVYCDDGEMQFNAWPMIDFLRDPLDVIERKIAEHGERRLREAMSAPAVSREAEGAQAADDPLPRLLARGPIVNDESGSHCMWCKAKSDDYVETLEHETGCVWLALSSAPGERT